MSLLLLMGGDTGLYGLGAESNLYVHMDFNQNEARKLTLENLGTDPVYTAVEGQIYYNAATKLPYFYNGTAWTAFGGGTHPDPHLLGNGSVGAPTYSFSGDINTGMYSTGIADTIGFAAGGALRVSINTTSTNIVGQLTVDDDFDVEAMYWMNVSP